MLGFRPGRTTSLLRDRELVAATARRLAAGGDRNAAGDRARDHLAYAHRHLLFDRLRNHDRIVHGLFLRDALVRGVMHLARATLGDALGIRNLAALRLGNQPADLDGPRAI